MEASHPHSSSSLPDDTRQQIAFQEPSNSHQPPSQSSQTYTSAPSGTGHGTSGQSMTATTSNFNPVADQAALEYQHSQVSSPDHPQDRSHLGSWATTIEPLDDTLVIGKYSLLSPNYRAGPTVNDANVVNETAGAVGEGGDTKKQAVELLRASLHRKV